MAFYAGVIAREPAMENPTIVVLTDRNDLDDQLFGTFARCQDLLGQPPAQAESRADLRKKLAVASGGVVFTTIQKFYPEDSYRGEKGDTHPSLSSRRNIVVIADEAHRSQYDFIDGFARHMRDALPNASFVGFTGTPIELRDANTRAVFGDYISIYDIQRAVLDGATVPIYYENRLAKLTLDEGAHALIDDEFEEATEGEEVERKERLKTRWAQLEAIVGAEQRVRLVAEDIVEHFEQRLDAIEGKAMVVCMSRRICIDLYRELVRPAPRLGARGRRQGRDQGGDDRFRLGPAGLAAAHPQQGAPRGPRQALPRRRRPAADRPRARHVADGLRRAQPAHDVRRQADARPRPDAGHRPRQPRVQGQARRPRGRLPRACERAEAGPRDIHRERRQRPDGRRPGRGRRADGREVRGLLRHPPRLRLVGVDRQPAQRLELLPPAQEHVLAQENGKERFVGVVRELEQAFALAVPHDETTRIRDDVAFFQSLRSALAKRSAGEVQTDEELDHAVRQIISRAVAPEGVVDIFAAAGLDKPDISILSEEFLAEVKGMPHRNLAIELLQKLLQGELATRRRKNVVQARSFSEMLEQSLRRYQNRAIEAAQVIEELIELAREMREAGARGEQLGLTDDELAFYDALETNDSAVQVLGDETLRAIARELVETVRNNVTIDWTLRENVRANLRRHVRRILRRHGYPPDKQEQATLTVLEQAEVLSEGWAAA